MGKYGDVALRATRVLVSGNGGQPMEAWDLAARDAFPGKLPSQKKHCPRSAFLGLCEDGLVSGVPRGAYGAGETNKSYAVEAARLLATGAVRPEEGASALWKRVMNGREKVPNSQMEVVLALWSSGLLVRRAR